MKWTEKDNEQELALCLQSFRETERKWGFIGSTQVMYSIGISL